MTWNVHLELVEGSSKKFWRARLDGATLYVNFGRLGTTGQTQVKELASAEAARKELDKLEREKRKKGYADAGAAPASDEADDDEGEADEDDDGETRDDRLVDDEVTARVPPRPRAAPESEEATLVLDARGRQIETRLVLSGATVRMDAVETYPSPHAARQAYQRLLAQLTGEGHREP